MAKFSARLALFTLVAVVVVGQLCFLSVDGVEKMYLCEDCFAAPITTEKVTSCSKCGSERIKEVKEADVELGKGNIPWKAKWRKWQLKVRKPRK